MGKISYRRQGDYLIPELTIGVDQPSYGKYGMLRKTYLKNHDPGGYTSLLLSGRLNVHLAETDTRARVILNDLIRSYLETHPAPDKAIQQMEWVGYMNSAKHCAEETVLTECIYI